MLWSLDTCGCQFDVDWDDANKQYALRKVVKNCGVHGSLAPQTLFDAARENNGRKNTTFGILEATLNMDVDTFSKVWSWDKNRALHVNLSSLNTSVSVKSSIQSKVNSQFGVGKVVVD